MALAADTIGIVDNRLKEVFRLVTTVMNCLAMQPGVNTQAKWPLAWRAKPKPAPRRLRTHLCPQLTNSMTAVGSNTQLPEAAVTYDNCTPYQGVLHADTVSVAMCYCHHSSATNPNLRKASRGV